MPWRPCIICCFVCCCNLYRQTKSTQLHKSESLRKYRLLFTIRETTTVCERHMASTRFFHVQNSPSNFVLLKTREAKSFRRRQWRWRFKIVGNIMDRTRKVAWAYSNRQVPPKKLQQATTTVFCFVVNFVWTCCKL